MEHRFLRLYKDGVWCGSPDRTIWVKGEQHNLDEYAHAHGIKLPDAVSKKQQQVNSYAGMEQTQSPGDIEVHGDGDSQSQE